MIYIYIYIYLIPIESKIEISMGNMQLKKKKKKGVATLLAPDCTLIEVQIFCHTFPTPLYTPQIRT